MSCWSSHVSVMIRMSGWCRSRCKATACLFVLFFNDLMFQACMQMVPLASGGASSFSRSLWLLSLLPLLLLGPSLSCTGSLSASAASVSASASSASGCASSSCCEWVSKVVLCGVLFTDGIFIGLLVVLHLVRPLLSVVLHEVLLGLWLLLLLVEGLV